MSKKLIIDKPDCCGNCPLILDRYSEQYEEWNKKCYFTGRNIIDTEKVDEKCPLKPMAQQIEIILPRKNGKTWLFEEIMRGEK